MADVFVSYKAEERSKAEALVSALQKLDLEVWYDYELAAGDAFGRVINSELSAAKAAVVCWSKAAVESDWVHGEADKARSLGIYASVRLEPCELPVPFNALHAADLSTWSGGMRHEGLRQLIDKLAKLTRRPLQRKYEALCRDEEETTEPSDDADNDQSSPPPEVAPRAQRILECVKGAPQVGARDLTPILAQASFEEEVLSNPRTKWLVSATDAAPAGKPTNALWTSRLEEALREARAGDIVVVYPGTYRGRFEVKHDIRLVGFGSKEERPILTGDNKAFVLELSSSPQIENIVIESRDPGHALQIDVDATPVVVRCVIERQQLTEDANAPSALWVSGGANPTFIACTIWGGFCPAVQFAARGQGLFISSDIFASESDAARIQGGCRPRFERCVLSANGGHAVISRGQAGGIFEGCTLKARGFSTIVNTEAAFSKFIANRISVRNGSLVEIKGTALGRFERNRLEPDPEGKAAPEPEPRWWFRKPSLPAIRPPAIAVSNYHRARFVRNILPDGRSLSRR